MKIAGIYPQTTDTSNIIIRSTYGEPLGLGKILAIAQNAGCEVLYEMSVGEPLEVIEARVEQFDPDIVAFSIMTCQYPAAMELAKRFKKRRKDRIILAGGYHPSSCTHTEPPFDAFIAGEGEISFQAIISSLLSGNDWSKSPGLILPHDRTPPPPRITNMEAFPWALRSDRILRQKYFGLIYPPESEQIGFAYVEYGRGCKSDCMYCCKNVIWNGKSVNYRDPEDVVKEMIHLKRENNVNLFFFTDLNFTGSSKKVFRLCDQMKIQGLQSSWFCMSNISTAKQPVLEEMAEAGCIKVMYGIESVEDGTLRLLKKNGNYKAEKDVVQRTYDLGILPHLFYMVGFEWENSTIILDHITKLKDLAGLQLRIGIATPMPGSAWYKSSLKGRCLDFGKYDCENLVYQHHFFTDNTLKEIITEIYNRFYQSQEYHLRVERFLSKWPNFNKSFKEFLSLLQESHHNPFLNTSSGLRKTLDI